MKKPMTDEELDALLFSAIGDETMDVPPPVQAALQRELRKGKQRWPLYWWVPALAGTLQTAAAAAVIQMLLPGSLAAYLAAVACAACSLSGVVLWGVGRNRWKKEVEQC